MKYMRFVNWLLSLIFFALTAACSGDGGATSKQTVLGVAATGAPIKGTVVLKDSKGTQLGPVNTDDDGNFSFDVTGLIPPFILKAAGVSGTQSHTIYSLATGSGNAHINPFSNLALQLVMGTDPSTVFGTDGSKPDIAAIDDAKLNIAQNKIKTLLAPILAEYGIIDFSPITGAYSATPGNKLDAMLDVIRIKIENGTITITNKLDGSIIVSGNLANITGLSIDKTKYPDKSTLMDIKEITDRLAVLRSFMNKGDILDIQDLENFFISDPNYGTSNGHSRAEAMASIVTIFGHNGTNKNGKLKSIRNVRLVSEQTANYVGRGVTRGYLINYDFIHENGTIVHGTNTTWAKEAASGIWKFIGDPANLIIGNNNGVTMTSDSVVDQLILLPSDAPVPL